MPRITLPMTFAPVRAIRGAVAALCALAAWAGQAHSQEQIHQLPSQIEVGDMPALRQALVSMLTDWNTARKRVALIEFMGAWPETPASPGLSALRWHVDEQNAHLRRIRVFVAPVGGRPHAPGTDEVELRFQLRDVERVWQARSTMREGQRLDCDADLVSSWRAVQTDRQPVWNGACQDLQALTLRRPLAAGDLLLAGDLGRPMAVRRLGTVTAVSQAGGIEIRTKARALADADVGQALTIKPANSTQTVKAIAIAVDTVQVN